MARMSTNGRGGRRLEATLLAAGILAAGCGGEPGEAPVAADPLHADPRRARAEALHAESRDFEALQQIGPLVEPAGAAAEDLLRATILALAMNDDATARSHLERARALLPADLSVQYLTGLLAQNQADFEAAAAAYRAVLAGDPADLTAKVKLADVLDILGQSDEALSLLRQVRAAGVDVDAALYMQATYQLAQATRGTPESAALLAEHSQLAARGFKPPSSKELEQRGWGRLQAPTPRGVPAGPPQEPRWPTLEKGETVSLPGATELLVADIDADGRPDLVGWGAEGVHAAVRDAQGALQVETVTDRPVEALAAGDVDEADPWLRDTGLNKTGPNPAHHPALELACLHPAADGAPAALVLWSRAAAGGWSRVGGETPWPADAHAVLFSDFDHDSLLDLLVAGEWGVSVLRNHGALRKEGESLQDVTPEALAAAGDCQALQAEDFDSDSDVDYLVLTDAGPRVFHNLRGGRFEDATAASNVPAGSTGAHAADLDEDGRADLILSGGAGVAWARGGPQGFEPARPLVAANLGRGLLADLDLDGHVDLLLSGPTEVNAWRGPLTGRNAPLPRTTLPLAAGQAAPLALADFDGDLAPDLAVLQPGAATIFRSGLRGAHTVHLQLMGTKDNSHGVGALVELRSGKQYRRVYARGEPLLLGLGEHAQGDVLKVTWPNGVPQFKRDEALAAGARLLLEQPKVLGGSCPFLYAWNGTKFAFVTDCLGASPLGLPAAPGVMVPWRSDEQLTLRGLQLVPQDGELRLVLTEELREVTYLDQLALRAVDHPAEVEIQTDERFSLPPYPPPHVHTLRDARPVARALAAHGGDVTALVADADGLTTRPFRQRAWQYTGLAEPWSVDLVLVEGEARRAELRDAPRIRLLVTAWMQWGDASVNLAAARHPEVEYELPALWVPEGDDPDPARRPWRRIPAPIGFPAGKTKTMVLDVTDVVRRDDPRLRITSTLQLALDAVRVDLGPDAAPLTDTRLEAKRATLGFRGFSRLLPDPEHERAELFEYDELMDARWNQHPGLYTRYGEVAPLLSAADDRYAIFGAGDALWAAFDAGALPPLPDGWTRDWVLELDGWAKDGDPNTVTSQGVEPLPFHGMTAYPPPSGEACADPAGFAAFCAEWNTRPAAVLLAPLSGTR